MVALIECPKCKRALSASERLGSKARCRTCGESFFVPEMPFGAGRIDNVAAMSARNEPEIERVTIRPSLPNGFGAREKVPPLPRPFRLVPLPPLEDAREETPRATACPRCKARVYLDDKACDACGEVLTYVPPAWDWSDPFPPLRMDYEPARGGIIIALGILGVCLGPLGIPAAIAAWVMGQNDLRKIEQNIMDPAGYLNTRDGMICGRIGTALGIVLTLFLGWMLAGW